MPTRCPLTVVVVVHVNGHRHITLRRDTDLVHFVPTVVYIGAYIGRIWGVYGVFWGVLGVYMMYIWCPTGVNMCMYGYKGV